MWHDVWILAEHIEQIVCEVGRFERAEADAGKARCLCEAVEQFGQAVVFGCEPFFSTDGGQAISA